MVLVIAAWLGWLVRGARIQREAVAAIKRAYGSVKYDWEQQTGSSKPSGKPHAPEWLVNAIGVDYFGYVTEVEVPPSSKSTHDVITRVEHFSRLERLTLDGPSVTDAELVILERLGNLSYLSLNVSRVTDAGLVHLAGLTKLGYLNLRGTKISDAGLAHLDGLTQLNWFEAEYTHISGPGLAHLRE